MTADANINGNTPGSTIVFCDYLMDKGYATAAQVNPWKTAIQRVFETVEGEGWEDLDLSGVELNEYGQRFQTLAGANYKAESVTTYRRRVTNALDAHRHYRETGRPPTFRKGGKRKTEEDKPAVNVVPMAQKPSAGAGARAGAGSDGLMTFPFPLDDGGTASLTLPRRMRAGDVNRLCAFLRTLQDDSEQRQIPRRTGEEEQQAA